MLRKISSHKDPTASEELKQQIEDKQLLAPVGQSHPAARHFTGDASAKVSKSTDDRTIIGPLKRLLWSFQSSKIDIDFFQRLIPRS